MNLMTEAEMQGQKFKSFVTALGRISLLLSLTSVFYDTNFTSLGFPSLSALIPFGLGLAIRIFSYRPSFCFQYLSVVFSEFVYFCSYSLVPDSSPIFLLLNILVIRSKFSGFLYVIIHSCAGAELKVGQIYMAALVLVLAVSLKEMEIFYEQKITHLKNKNKSLNTNIKLISEISSDGIAVLNSELETMYSNSQIFTLLNHPPELLTQVLSRLSYTKRTFNEGSPTNTILEDIQLAFSLEQNCAVFLGKFFCSDAYFELLASSVEWKNANCIMLIVRDISVKNYRNDSLLVKIISHELKTPTASILSHSESLSEALALPESLKNRAKLINSSSNLLLNFIRNIIDATKFQSRKFSLKKQYINIHETLEFHFNLFIPCAKINYSLKIDPCVPKEVFTDPHRLSQVLTSLIGNSVKYTRKGKIEVIAFLSRSSKLMIKVIDSGPGIHQEKIDEIHESRDDFNHLKIGLQLTNQICTALGGTPLAIKSTLNKGTIVKFLVDVIEEESTELEKMSEEDEGYIEEINSSDSFTDRKNGNLLVVDDNEFNRMALATILTKFGLEFLEAANGLEALQVVREMDKNDCPIKVIVMDIDMPIMNGYETTLSLRQMFTRQLISESPRIIGYSALTSDEEILKCYESGMDCFLNKPSPSREIINTIKNYLY